MGRNNIENRSKDKNWGKNLTRNCLFKFEILNEEFCRRFELAQGLTMNKLSITIRVNAKSNINQDDSVEIKGRKYKVITTSKKYDNDNQGRFKASLNDYTGYTIIGLE